MTLDQVSDYLSVRRHQVYSLVRSGDLPAVKLGNRGIWRVDRRELENYIQRASELTQQWVRSHPRTTQTTLRGGKPWRDESAS